MRHPPGPAPAQGQTQFSQFGHLTSPPVQSAADNNQDRFSPVTAGFSIYHFFGGKGNGQLGGQKKTPGETPGAWE